MRDPADFAEEGAQRTMCAPVTNGAACEQVGTFRPTTSDGVWFDAPGFPWFLASREGRVKSRSTGRIVGSNVNECGYLRASGPHGPIKVHQIVAAAFIGPRPDGLVTNHIDGDKLNNRPENLEYVTASENHRHAWRTGLVPHRLINDDLIEEIKRLRILGYSVKAIEKVTGVSTNGVRRKLAAAGFPARVKLQVGWRSYCDGLADASKSDWKHVNARKRLRLRIEAAKEGGR